MNIKITKKKYGGGNKKTKILYTHCEYNLILTKKIKEEDYNDTG